MILIAVLIASAASAADQTAIFTAAGFTRRGKNWRTDCDQGAPSYAPGAIETYSDLNGDGRPEAVVTEGSTFCYGSTEAGFWLLSKQANGRWAKLYESQGIAQFLKTRGASNMPDISVGGPGFCFPVVRWNGRNYVQHRFEYEGKRCRPSR
jgi:hypothetical protein